MRGKSPKARQGLCPLESPGAWSPPFSRSLRCAPSRAGLPSAIKQDRFATLSWWANRSCFFLWFHRGNTLFFQSVARQILYLRGCLKVLFTSTNTARAQGWGNPRGSTPLCWGSRDQEVPGVSFAALMLLLSSKVIITELPPKSLIFRIRKWLQVSDMKNISFSCHFNKV